MKDPLPSSLGFYPNAEIVFALVCPLGIDYMPVVQAMRDYLGQVGYSANVIKLTEYFSDLLQQYGESYQLPQIPIESAKYKISAGNRIRQLTKKQDILALIAASSIAVKRSETDESSITIPAPLAKTVSYHYNLKETGGSNNVAKDLWKWVFSRWTLLFKAGKRGLLQSKRNK